MPFPHQRRRGATILFRRKIPNDLRGRFGSTEIVRSLGRVTPGEARRISHHLWSQTELAFMFVRREANLTRDEVVRVVDAAVSQFRDQAELALASVRPGVAEDWLSEPAQTAAKLQGAAVLFEQALASGNLNGMAETSCCRARDALGKQVVPDSLDERRLSRSLMRALRSEMQDVAGAFGSLANRRPDSFASPLRAATEYDISPADLAALRSAKIGDNVAHLIKQLDPAPNKGTQASSEKTDRASASPHLRNANKTVSELWNAFCDNKIAMKEWKPNEAISARTTLKLWTQLQGDFPPSTYFAGDVSSFHQRLKKLPAMYYHAKEFRRIYETNGVQALIEATEKQVIDRLSDKTWNSHNSVLNEFFKWCAGKGEALPKGTESICVSEFVRIPKRTKAKRGAEDARRCYKANETKALFSSPKYRGCASKRNWKDAGQLVFRDHRYWLPLIAASHGCRREEPTVLKVRHVKQTTSGIWYFNWDSSELTSLLKDVGSPRDVPVHRDLLALGFLEARVIGRDPNAMLFPEAISHGQMGRNAEPFGKWYGLFCTACGITDPALDFHAWRHTVVTGLLNAGVPEAHIEAIIGHESERRRSVLGDYDHGRELETLKLAIDKLVVGIDVQALNKAIARSDAADRAAAWPDLTDPSIVPKPRNKQK